MTKKPIFVVTLNTTVLPRARVFGALEDSVHSAFQRHSIFIDKSSPILRSNKKRAWRVVSETSRSVEAFRLELSHNKNTDEEVIKVFEDTVSGLPQNLWDFRIFTSDVPTPVAKQTIYYTGSISH